jgi:hypothetical protein
MQASNVQQIRFLEFLSFLSCWYNETLKVNNFNMLGGKQKFWLKTYVIDRK